MEDTAFYVYNRLVSLNEVGGDPAGFGATADQFHRFSQMRQDRWPLPYRRFRRTTRGASEDVRARINVLSEIPQEWFERVERWRGWNACHRVSVDDLVAPDANEEYLLYQTLVGAWPLEVAERAVPREFVERIQNYMVKAGHEAKRHSSWINPDPDYDNAIRAFVGLILDERSGHRFWTISGHSRREVSHFGLLNSLGQTLLKLAAPGVADTFQGCELWDFSLVDPDNRRPVDYGLWERMLGDLKPRSRKSAAARMRLCRKLPRARTTAGSSSISITVPFCVPRPPRTFHDRRLSPAGSARRKVGQRARVLARERRDPSRRGDTPPLGRIACGSIELRRN